MHRPQHLPDETCINMHQDKKKSKDIPPACQLQADWGFCYSEAEHVPLKENYVDYNYNIQTFLVKKAKGFTFLPIFFATFALKKRFISK